MTERGNPRRIVVLTGAGLSAESGLSTFRDAGGLWEQHDIYDVATPEGYARDPALVLRFYSARRAALAGAAPNAAHMALARLATADPHVLLVTQNVDDLLERAGATGVLHMHGELLKTRCVACGSVHADSAELTLARACPACDAVGSLRPDVVWFGEMPFHMEAIEAALSAADLFVAIGTSGTVYPAAGFVEVAARSGARTVELNLDRTQASPLFAEHRAGPATYLVPAWVDEVIGDK